MRTSDEIIQTLSWASYATAGSVARSKVPPPVYLVRPGRRPLDQVAPLSLDVANPIAHAPPS